LRRKEPELYARARHFCLPHDYLNLWLTGEFCSEPGDASGTAYFDVRKRGYSKTVLTMPAPTGIGQCLRDLASPRSSEAPQRSRKSRAAEIPVAPAAVPACAAIGAGAVVPGPVIVSSAPPARCFPSTARDRPGQADILQLNGQLAVCMHRIGAKSAAGGCNAGWAEVNSKQGCSLPCQAQPAHLHTVPERRTPPNRPAGVGISSTAVHTRARTCARRRRGLTFGLRAMRWSSRSAEQSPVGGGRPPGRVPNRRGCIPPASHRLLHRSAAWCGLTGQTRQW
jgi:hypothetical protein